MRDNQVRNSDVYRRIDRLVNFSDGVLAIAVTLLVLPLADRVTNEEFDSFGTLYEALGTQFLLFTISFIVICRFWLVHHNIFQSLKKFNATIFGLNCVWLFSIVLIPFFTELLGKTMSGNGLASSLYIFNILVLSLTGVLIQFVIKNHSELQTDSAVIAPLSGSLAVVLIIAVALIATVVFSITEPWPLLLLVFSSPTQKILARYIAS